MAPVRGDLVRPLLRLRRADVHRFVALEGLPAVEDPTNQDRRIPRNLVRHELLPRLAEVGPDVVGALARLADLARDDARTLDAMAAAAAADVVRQVGPVMAVPLDFLADADAAVTRRVLRQLVLAVRGGSDPPTAAEVETLRGLTVGALDLSGATVSAAGGWLAMAPPELPAPPPVVLPLPGRVAWPVVGWQVRARTPDTPGQGQLQLGLVETWRPPHVAIADDLLPPGADVALGQVVLGGLAVDALTLRARQPGDRIVTGAGTRKLQDVYVDAGVPRLVRDLLPVVVAGDRVVWVPGLAVDEHARLRGLANPQVHLAVSRR
jgi:tRNA(Ile)-lysidine synthase